jgi:hypothetical protein
LAHDREIELVVEAVTLTVSCFTADGEAVRALFAEKSKSRSIAESEADSEAAAIKQTADMTLHKPVHPTTLKSRIVADNCLSAHTAVHHKITVKNILLVISCIAVISHD